MNSNQSRGKDNTYWYAVLKKGKVFERYIGKHNGGVWEDTYIKGAKSKTMPSGCTIKLIAEKAFLSQTDIKNFNAHYQKLEVKMTNAFHDRFMVLDDKTVYYIGASIKDAGKKCFGITLIQDDTMANDLISRLKKIKWLQLINAKAVDHKRSAAFFVPRKGVIYWEEQISKVSDFMMVAELPRN